MSKNLTAKAVILIAALMGTMFLISIKSDLQFGFAVIILMQAVVNWKVIQFISKA